MPGADFPLPDQPASIPQAWQDLDLAGLRGAAMILGGPDSGKSTFSQHAFHTLHRQGHLPALLDADPGQGALGPPATLSLRLGSEPSGPRWFIGSNSPSGHMLDQVVGVARLTAAARHQGADVVLIDTCGLVSREAGGHALKWAEFQMIRPKVVYAMAPDQELTALVDRIERQGVKIRRLAGGPQLRKRGAAVRARLRAASYRKYFAGAGELKLDRRAWPGLAAIDRLVEGRVIGLLDRSGFLLALGLALSLSKEKLTLLTPLPSSQRIAEVVLGELVVELPSYRDRRLEPA